MGPANEYPGLKAKPSGCMKDKKNHARQQTDTSTINMFFNDEAFKKIVLGENYFRINRLTDFTPPPVCGDTNLFRLEIAVLSPTSQPWVLSTEAIVGIGIGAGVLVIIALIVAGVLICARSSDEGAFMRVGSGSATTNV